MITQQEYERQQEIYSNGTLELIEELEDTPLLYFRRRKRLRQEIDQMFEAWASLLEQFLRERAAHDLADQLADRVRSR